MDFHPKLTAAIEENFKWIRKKCLISEWDRVKREELINEVLYNLYDSNKYFIKQTDVTPIAWVKRITTNVTSKYVQDEMRENQFFDKESLDLDSQSQTSSQEVHDLRIVSEFIKKNFSIKDQEIMNLHSKCTEDEQKDFSEMIMKHIRKGMQNEQPKINFENVI